MINRADVKDTVYDLYSVLVHHGYLGSGHYISYIWDHDAASWFEMNDNVCKPTSPTTVGSQSAYLLFYKKRAEKWTGLEKLHLSERSIPSSPLSPKSPPPSHNKRSSNPTSPRGTPTRIKTPIVYAESDTEPDASDVDIETVEESEQDTSDETPVVVRLRSGRTSLSGSSRPSSRN